MLIALDEWSVSLDLSGVTSLDLSQVVSGKYYCPSCRAEVVLKNGETRRPHFAHKRTSECRTFSEGETKEHLAGKQLVADWCIKTKTPYQLEAYLPSLKQRPDILIDGKLAIEFQCSHLPISRLVERTNNYLRAGYQVIWLVGQSFFIRGKLTSLQKAMIYFSERLGFYFWELDVSKQELRCVYQIEERLISREVIKSEKRWQVGLTDFRLCLTFPKTVLLFQKRVYDLKDEVTQLETKIATNLAYKNTAYLKLQGQCYLLNTSLQYFPYRSLGLILDNLMAKDSSFLWWLSLLAYLKVHPINERALLLKKLRKMLQQTHQYYKMPLISIEIILSYFIDQALHQLWQRGLLDFDEKTMRVRFLDSCLDRRDIPCTHQSFDIETINLQTCIPCKYMLL